MPHKFFNHFPSDLTAATNLCKNFPRHLRELLSLSIPLTANRVLINLLQSIEAISIPIQLRRFSVFRLRISSNLWRIKRNGFAMHSISYGGH